jgi:hypothetical protein
VPLRISYVSWAAVERIRAAMERGLQTRDAELSLGRTLADLPDR